MIEYQISDHPPHLNVRLSGPVSEEEVRDTFRGFEEDLQSLPPDYAVIVSCLDSTYFTPAAVGPLYYYVVQAADTEPGLTILLYGDADPSPHLSAFLRRLVPGNRVRIARSVEEAEKHLKQERQAKYSEN